MKKLAVVFPGQGSQYVGMGQELFKTAPGREVWQTGLEVLGEDFLALIREGSEDRLTLTANAQPAILLVSMAAWAMLKQAGIRPDYLAGHSLGEYSAYVAAGSITLADGLKIVKTRGELMQQAVPQEEGGMAAILGLARDLVEEVCRQACDAEGIVVAANYNSANQIVISGELKALRRALALAKERGAKRTVELSVSGPFHSPYMKDVEAKLTEVLNSVNWAPPAVPVVANVHAKAVTHGQTATQLLAQQVSHAVLWEDSIHYLVEQGVEVFVECGPGKVLSGLIRKIAPQTMVLNVEDQASFEKSLASLKESGYNVAE